MCDGLRHEAALLTGGNEEKSEEGEKKRERIREC